MSPTRPTHASALQLLHAHRHLSVAARDRALALYAHRHAGTEHLTSLLDELRDHGHGRTCLHMAEAATHTPTITRLLRDPDPALRRAALGTLKHVPVPDEALEPVLEDAPTDLRRAFYHALFLGRRTALADRLLPRVRQGHGDPDTAALLPACTPATVLRELPGLAHAVVSWRRLAHRHPETLIDLLDRARAEGEDPRSDWNGALRALDPVRPESVALLLGDVRYNPRTYPCAHRTRTHNGNDVFYDRSYPPLHDGTRSRVLLRQLLSGGSGIALQVLRAMPWAERRRYLSVGEGEKGLSLRQVELLEVLPEDLRRTEAERLLERCAEARRQRRNRDPNTDLDVLAHLPLDEVAPALREAASDPDPFRRARGLACLVRAIGRAGRVAEHAELIRERAERAGADRGPVRLALTKALAALDAGSLAEHLLPALRPLLRAAVESRDVSAETLRALREVSARLLGHPGHGPGTPARAFALQVHTLLIGVHGTRALAPAGPSRHRRPWWFRTARGTWRNMYLGQEPPLDQVLSQEDATELLAQLEPVLRAAAQRGEHGLAAALAGSLGRRGRDHPELEEALAAAVREDPEGAGQQAAQVLLDRPDAPDRALALWERSPAAIRAPRVRSVLSRHAPPHALAAAFDEADRRREATGKVWVPQSDPSVLRRWPAALRARAARHLRAVAADTGRAAGERERALLALSTLPGGAVDDLAAHLHGDEGVLREGAALALGRCDRPGAALDVLTQHGPGAATPSASGALSNCARRIAPSALGPRLVHLLHSAERLSHARAAARMLARHRPPGWLPPLLDVLHGPHTHRDLRAAATAALMGALDVPGAASALRRVLRPDGEPRARVEVLSRHPRAVPAAVRIPLAVALLKLVDDGEEDDLKCRAGSLARWVCCLPDPSGEVLDRLREPVPVEMPLVRIVDDLARWGILDGDRTLDAVAELVAEEPVDGGGSDPRWWVEEAGADRLQCLREALILPGAPAARDERYADRLDRLFALLSGHPYQLPAALVAHREATHSRMSASDGEGVPALLADRVHEVAELLAEDPLGNTGGIAEAARHLTWTPASSVPAGLEPVFDLLTERLPELSGRVRTVTGLIVLTALEGYSMERTRRRALALRVRDAGDDSLARRAWTALARM
ncbi:hypothetical protein IDM40_03290 [Nocardiopsis sp. HNM0947]|uniref:HEAT repeat domain-containing protein n=1 Tax=Nocardiopsis coralli TaxID=2772213 RepID=A0ABR9P1L7_9ACTN|nr:HEAT repeat domain-containing protein [Nocardiopsis coralli]MBE2997736.1 hypothetical protein [Nocardiopsis coralli]